MAVEEWFREIREAADRAIWSRGVELARADRVHEVGVEPDRILLLVRAAAGERAPRVELHPELLGWDCDCGSPEDPCEHVAAAAIAWRRSREDGTPLPKAEGNAPPTIHYELEAGGEGLKLRRFAGDGAAAPLEASLRAITRGRVAGPSFEVNDADREIDEILGDRHGETVPRGVLPRLLSALRGLPLRFDGAPVEIADRSLSAKVILEDAPGGFRLKLQPAATAREQVAPGLALRDGALHPVDEGSLTGRERESLPRGAFYSNDRAAELVDDILPDLEGRVLLEVRAKRLPRSRSPETPRLCVRSERVGDALRLRADIVYGDPPRARIEGSGAGTLIALGGALPVRDPRAEAVLSRRIQQQLKLPVGSSVDLRGEEAFEVAACLAAEDPPMQGSGHRDFFRAPDLGFKLGDPGGFDPRFEAELAADPTRASSAVVAGKAAETVLDAWERGESWVSLDGGGFARLPSAWLERYGRVLASFLEARSPRQARKQPPPAFSLPDWAALCEASGAAPPSECESFRVRVERFGQAAPPPLPSDLRAELRSYQVEGVAWLAALRQAGLGALLADDMGLGKTLQVLCSLQGRSLVVAPTSVLSNWSHEAQRFRPGLRVCRYHGPTRRLDPQANLTLTSYAILRRDVEQLGSVLWDNAVLDEAQAIKNPDSQVARAAGALRAKWRVSLTGTPVENRLDELWSQLHFLNPGHMGSRARFSQRYAKPIEAGDETRAEELRRRIRPFVLRRLKKEVARELPQRTDLVLRVELDDEERRVYDALQIATRREVRARFADSSATAARTIEALEALLRLRQAACHRGLIPGQEADRSSKVELLLEQLDTAVAEGHKALVFSQWTALLDRVEAPLRDAGIRFVRLDGSTRDREGVVASFQSDDGPPVFLVSLRAGGTGLNLTAADHVFLMDPWWNPAVEEQAADRAHRIGQDKPVFVHRLVTADSVEEKILALQERKRSAANSALAVAGATAALSRDELLELLD
jgi:superfamily II DNA or RNA helicase